MKVMIELIPLAMKPEKNMTIGPKTTSMRAETMKISRSGTNIDWMTAGIQRSNHGSKRDASHAATIIGKIVDV